MSKDSNSMADSRRVAPYWFVIGIGLLLALGLYLYHLITGVTPSRVAFTLPGLDLPVYWYGIWIVGGIGLGATVVAALAQERARQVFTRTVPPALQTTALDVLALPEAIQKRLVDQGLDTLGALLFQWGLDRQVPGLKQQALVTVEAQLRAQPQVDPQWLEDAPWRVWNAEHVWNGLIWCLVLGLIGARLYHVLTPSPSLAAIGIESPLDYFRNPTQLLNFRSGGLGIYGGIAGGALGLWLYARRARIPALAWADLAVVGLALGQVFGRWGNFFNQELFGRPTTLPWAVTIDPAFRLPQYADESRFHPAFLYEALWSLLTFGVLYALLQRKGERLLPGEVMALYLILYAIGRSLLELVRLDSRLMTFLGLNVDLTVATFVSILVALITAGWVLVRRWRRQKRPFPANSV